MAIAAADIARLRRMTAEPDEEGVYTDEVLSEIAGRYPLPDADGLWPDHIDWVDTYDLNAAAAEVWGEKAAALAGEYDFTSDGASFSRSQAHANALKQQRHYSARRAPGSFQVVRAEALGDDLILEA